MTMEIRLQRRLDHSPQRVWQALTDSKALARWLMPNDFQARLGHRFRFEGKPMPGWRGFVECEVVELDEPHVIAFSWLGDEDWTQPTVVRFSLEPDGGGTRLTLEHTGFAEPWGSKVIEMFKPGWGSMLDRLAKIIASPAPAGSG